MIDLSAELTLIIPLKIEHEDRFRNFQTVLGFLDYHFKIQVFIFESVSDFKLDLSGFSNLTVRHFKLNEENKFHRTKYLNIMLDNVTTTVVANYDIDVLLDPTVYFNCTKEILDQKADVIYPYGYGSFQIQIPSSFDHLSFRSSYDVNNLKGKKNLSRFGHCIFFNTQVYRSCGGENEEFVSYGPEDIERAYRFNLMKKKISWRTNFVYHFEHFRGKDSSNKNTDFFKNVSLFQKIRKMSVDDFKKYYASLAHYHKYTNIKFDV